MDDRELARLIATLRVSAGTVAFVAPRWTIRTWTGQSLDSGAANMVARSLAGREIAIGLGTVIAMNKDAPVRGWIEAGMVADLTDALASFFAIRRIAPIRALLSAVASGASVALGYRLADALG
jgi:hypothetical protein